MSLVINLILSIDCLCYIAMITVKSYIVTIDCCDWKIIIITLTMILHDDDLMLIPKSIGFWLNIIMIIIIIIIVVLVYENWPMSKGI